MPSPPPELSARAARAREAAELADRRRRELERNFDSTVGSATRRLLAIAFGVVWTLVPLVFARLPAGTVTYRLLLGGAVLALLGGLGFAVWARESMTKTVVNRALIGGGLLALTGQVGIFTWALTVGIDVWSYQAISFLLWSSICTLLAVTIERWLALSAAGYLLAFVVVLFWPKLGYDVMAAANAVLTALVVKIWPRRPPGAPT
jgi:hypothetical protein